MFEDSPYIEGFPYYGDKANYFPTRASMTSYNFGPIEVDPTKREKFLQFEEISLTRERIVIDDWHTLEHKRESQIINVAKTREATEARWKWNWERTDGERHLIKTKHLVMIDLGELHNRSVTSIWAEIAEVGGLLEFFYIAAWAWYCYAGKPFRQLDLGINFSKLITQMKKKIDKMTYDLEKTTRAYE